MTKTEAISQMILNKMASVQAVEGCAFNDSKVVRKAIDYVLGEGTYDRLVSETYDALRAKAEG